MIDHSLPTQRTAATPPAALPIDDVRQTFEAIALHASPRVRALIEVMLNNMVSRMKNHAQILCLRGEAWHREAERTVEQEDRLVAERYCALSDACNWVGDELIVLLGREMRPRSTQIRPFEFPQAWRKDPPSERELEEFHATGAERREEGGASC